MPAKPLTLPEALAASLVTLLAAVITVSYLWGRAGTVSPFAILGFTIAAGAIITIALIRRSTRDLPAAIATGVIIALTLAWLLSLAWPTLLPPGGGPDLTHHLMLVDFLERRWQLPDATLFPVMGEMAHYTPGVHLLSALTGAWARIGGLHTIYLVAATSVALKCGLVLLIALRTLPASVVRVPMAIMAVVLCVLPKGYLLGSFAHDSFFAQTLAELFTVAMWWSLVVWQQRAESLLLLIFAACAIGAFLTWPVFIGAPVVTLIAIALARFDMPIADRMRALAIGLGPLVNVGAIHTSGRIGWLGMAGASGAVLEPSLSAFGLPFVIIAAIGICASVFHPPARTTLLLVLAIAAQAVTLYIVASSRGASTPYMAFKMVYLAIYPLAVLGAVGAGIILDRFVVASAQRQHGAPRVVATLAWVLLVVGVFAYRKPLVAWPRHAPVVSSDLARAGRWARANIEAACVDYLVSNADTMYWLHLAVLGNPRTSTRTADPTTFEPARAVGRWLAPDGLPYAIADLTTLPKEVANDVDVLEQFGTAAVVKRRGPSFCADAQRLVRR